MSPYHHALIYFIEEPQWTTKNILSCLIRYKYSICKYLSSLRISSGKYVVEKSER